MATQTPSYDKVPDYDPDTHCKVSVNKDFYGLIVVLRYKGYSWWVVVLTMVLTLSIFMIQYTMVKTFVLSQIYKSVFTSTPFMWWMKIGFLFLNWCSFQLPIVVHAQRLFMVNLVIADVFGALQICALFPIAYFAASLIVACETPIAILYTYLKLGIVMGLDDAILMALTRVVNYYKGDDFLKDLIEYEVSVRRDTTSRKIYKRIKPVWPIALFGVSALRWLESTGPVDFHFPLPAGAEHFYEHLYQTMGDSLEYVPPKDTDMSAICKKEGSNTPMVYVTDAVFEAAALRAHPHLAANGEICAPKYVLVPEPWLIPAFSNNIMWIANHISDSFQYMRPGPGKVPKKYLEKNEPGNRDDDELRMTYCGVCAANGMTCIMSDSPDCSDAADFLDAEAVETSPQWPLTEASHLNNLAEHIHGLDHYADFLAPVLKTMGRTDCIVKPSGFKGFQAIFVRWHACEVTR